MLFVMMCAILGQPVVGASVTPRFEDVSLTNLPAGILGARSMDVEPVDIDADGDIDLIVAQEFSTNHILLNDGNGVFTDGAPFLLPQPQPSYDSEDIAIADFDFDGHLDILFVSEDNQTNELYYWNAEINRFDLVTGLLGVTGVSNACVTADFDADGDPDIIIGNAGQNQALMNNGDGTFTNESIARLGAAFNITQDLEFGDIDADGDLDLIVGNEDNNQLLINDGNGFFTDETAARIGVLVNGTEMTREADFGDVDGDGDLDLLFANVMFQQSNDPQDRLFINDGRGFFTDETATRLPVEGRNSIEGDFFDMDADGDLDILVGYFMTGGLDVLQNDGTGVFKRRTPIYLPAVPGDTMDTEAIDLNADGLIDLYACHYLASDRLFFGK